MASQTVARRGLSRSNSAISRSGVRSLAKGGLGITGPASGRPRRARLDGRGPEHLLHHPVLVDAAGAAEPLRPLAELAVEVEPQRAEQGEVGREVQPLV